MKRLFQIALVALFLVCFARTARAAEPDQPARPTIARQTPVFVRAYGGAARGAALESVVTGPSGGLGLGVGLTRRPWGGFDGALDIGYAALATPHDIGIHRLALSASGELSIGRFRFGIGADVGSAWIARVSSSKISAQTYCVGGHATLGVDLFRIDRTAVYVAARGDLNAYVPSLGGSGGLRVTF